MGGGSENKDAICIIVNHRGSGYQDDVQIVKKLFGETCGYDMHEVDPLDNETVVREDPVLRKLKQINSQNIYQKLVLFIFGECDPKNMCNYKETMVSNSIDSDNYLSCFDKLNEKPKLLIQHMWHKSYHVPKTRKSVRHDPVGSQDGFQDPRVNTLQVFSKIIDRTGNFSTHSPLFIHAMERIFKTSAECCDIIELFTEVCREVEIKQYNSSQGEVTTVTHGVSFAHNLWAGFRIKTPDDRSGTPPVGKNQSTDNLEVKLLSQNRQFHLFPEQYDELNSMADLKKIPVMRIELKRQKLPNPVGKYPMDQNTRGFCLIINMSNNRTGSFVDELKMYQLFKELYFETRIINSRSHAEIEEEVQRLSKQITKQHQCLFVLLMAHGGVKKETHTFQDVCGDVNDSSYIFDCFNLCDNLIGKPKVYIIQTCFGSGSMIGISPKSSGTNDATATDFLAHLQQTVAPEAAAPAEELPMDSTTNIAPPTSVTATTPILPAHTTASTFTRQDTQSEYGDDSMTEGDDFDPDDFSMSSFRRNVPHEVSDVFKLNATIDGYKSYRSASHGAYVFQAIDRIFRDYAAEHDVVHLMTMVTAYVAKETFNDDEKQQPITHNTFRSFLFLNPGYIERNYQSLAIKDTGSSSDNYEAVVEKTLQGTVSWISGSDLVIGSNTSAKLTFIRDGKQAEEISFEQDTQSRNNIRGVIAGMAMSGDEHIVILTTWTGTRTIHTVNVDSSQKTWRKTINNRLSQTIVSPLTLCEINDDCFGVLCGTPNTHESATIEVYMHSAISATNKDNTFTPIQPENIIRVNYAANSVISLRDQICYSQTKFYLLGFYRSTVYQVNINGTIENSRTDFASKPVALLNGPNGSIDVACSNDVYSEAFGHKTKKRLSEICTNWCAGRYIGVNNNTRSMQSLPQVQQRGQRDPHSEHRGESRDIISEFMLSKYEHIIIYTTLDNNRKIVYIELDPKQQTWNEIMDLSNAIRNPLKMCEINNDCCAVLCGTPGTCGDIIIAVYSFEELRRIVKGSSQSAKSISTTETQCVIRVNYNTDSAIDLRDQIWYHQSKFYILNFNQTSVYQVNINCKEDSKQKIDPQPVALLKGRDGMIDVECSQQKSTDVFDQRKKVPLDSQSYPRWYADKYIAVFSNTSDKLNLILAQDTENKNKAIELDGPTDNIAKGIYSGVQLSENEHIIIYRTNAGAREIVVAALDREKKIWNIKNNLTQTIIDPRTTCEIDDDRFGVLRGTPNKDVTIEVYTRDEIRRFIKETEPPADQNHASIQMKAQCSFQFKYIENADEPLQDLMCYSQNTFFILSCNKRSATNFYDVSENDGKTSYFKPDLKFASPPLALLTGPDGNIAVACSNGMYTDVFGQMKRVPLTETYPRWLAGKYAVVCSHSNDILKLCPVQYTENENNIIELDGPSCRMAKGILSGYMLSEEAHLITYVLHNGNREIAAATFNKERKAWSKIMDLTKTIENPLSICQVNNSHVAVLRGIPNTHDDVTIDVYSHDKIHDIMKAIQDSSIQIKPMCTIRVNYARDIMIDLQDQICYSHSKFYILSFKQSSVYQVNANGKIEDSKMFDSAVALLRGPGGTIDVVCSQEKHTDVFAETKKIELTDSNNRWSVSGYMVAFSNTCAELNFISVQDTDKGTLSIKLVSPTGSIVSGVIAGIMLKNNFHIIVYTTFNGEREIVACEFDTEREICSRIVNLTKAITNPLNVCEVSNDRVGVLRGCPGAIEAITVDVYNRDTILKLINDKSTERDFLSSPIQTENVLRISYPTQSKIDLQDKICYSNDKFYVLNFKQSVVYRVNTKGKIEDCRNVDSQSVALLRGPDGTIDVVCSQEKYTDVFDNKTKNHLTDSYNKWSDGKNEIVFSNKSAKLSFIPIKDTDKEKLSIELDSPAGSIVSGVLAGIMLSENEYLIIYKTLQGELEIIAAALDREKKTWRKLLNLTKTITNPLTMCEIGNDCFGVLRGTPNPDEDVTIDVYTRDEIRRVLKKTSKSSKSLEKENIIIQKIYAIQVNYTSGSKIDIRDKICYSQNKFYILSFEQSTVYQMNISGSIQSSSPVALLKGPADTTHIVCCNAMYADIFNQKKIRLAENYASYMLKQQDKAVVMFDPGLDFSTFPLIPKFQLQDDCESTAISLKSNYQYQCVWPTNTQGVVAVGSAESCHISLAKCNDKIAKTRTYLGGFDKPAKILQGIHLNCHLNEETHLVLFDVYEIQNDRIMQIKKTLKFITINVDMEKIVMNTGNSNTSDVQSIANPVAICIIDGHTFGVVCKTNGSDEIKMYDRKQLTPVKEVKLQKSCIGNENVSACVDAHGEFYISNYSKHEINHFDVNGLHKRPLSTNELDPYRVMVDKDNEVFILCQDAIYRLKDGKFVEAFKFDNQSQDDTRQSTGVTQQQTDDELNTKQSWDVCFFGNLMYSVFGETLNVYETSKGALKTTIDSLAKKQKPSEVETTGQNVQEITKSPTTATSPATTTGDAMDTDLCTRI